MNLIPLPKDETKKLEHEVIRIENLFNNNSNPFDRIHFYNKMIAIQGWYHRHGLRPAYVKEQWVKLTELFGFKPTYYVTYVCRNALWAFKWEDQPVLIYKDQRGLAITVLPKFRKDLLKKFLKELKKVLI